MSTAMETEGRPAVAALDEQLARIGTCDIALLMLTYNNADTLPALLATTARALHDRFASAATALVAVDVGSSDATRESLAGSELRTITIPSESPTGERVAVPFHGVPGRGKALRAGLATTQRLGARAVLVLEADLVSLTPDWIARLLTPVWDEKADFVAAAYARHRFDGTITNLLVAPLVRALYGRRIRQPLGGQQALSAKLIEHLLLHPKWDWGGRELVDVWILGTAIADGFSVWEAWLGARQIHSRTRTNDLPAMVSQTLGGVFSVMDRHDDLWRGVRGSEPVRAVGEPSLPGVEPRDVDIERMVHAFRLGPHLRQNGFELGHGLAIVLREFHLTFDRRHRIAAGRDHGRRIPWAGLDPATRVLDQSSTRRLQIAPGRIGGRIRRRERSLRRHGAQRRTAHEGSGEHRYAPRERRSPLRLRDG